MTVNIYHNLVTCHDVMTDGVTVNGPHEFNESRVGTSDNSILKYVLFCVLQTAVFSLLSCSWVVYMQFWSRLNQPLRYLMTRLYNE